MISSQLTEEVGKEICEFTVKGMPLLMSAFSALAFQTRTPQNKLPSRTQQQKSVAIKVN